MPKGHIYKCTVKPFENSQGLFHKNIYDHFVNDDGEYVEKQQK